MRSCGVSWLSTADVDKRSTVTRTDAHKTRYNPSNQITPRPTRPPPPPVRPTDRRNERQHHINRQQRWRHAHRQLGQKKAIERKLNRKYALTSPSGWQDWCDGMRTLKAAVFQSQISANTQTNMSWKLKTNIIDLQRTQEQQTGANWLFIHLEMVDDVIGVDVDHASRFLVRQHSQTDIDCSVVLAL